MSISLMSFIDEAIIRSNMDQKRSAIELLPKLGLAGAKLSIKNGHFSSFKMVINGFFIANEIQTFTE